MKYWTTGDLVWFDSIAFMIKTWTKHSNAIAINLIRNGAVSTTHLSPILYIWSDSYARVPWRHGDIDERTGMHYYTRPFYL